MGKKKRTSNSLMACIAVALVAVVAIFGVGFYGLVVRVENNAKNNGKPDTAGEHAIPNDTADNSTTVSTTEPSSPSSSEQSSSTPSSTITHGDAGKKDFPENDGDKVCYLTFDDGPSTKVTTRVLDTLKEYNAKATFFVTGTGNLDMLKRMNEEGHAIGLHANNHEYSVVYKSTDAFFKDINALSDKVYNKIGIRPTIIRFPGGSNNTISRKYCTGVMSDLVYEVQQKGYQYFDWNVDSQDANASVMTTIDGSKRTPKDTIVKSVLNGAKNKDKICVLMHDIAVKTTTADALPEIIEGLREQGFRFEVLTNSSPVFHYKVAN